MLLEGKKAIITGGARGIGKEIVILFLKNGCSVYYIDLQEGDSLAEYQKIAKENKVTVGFKQGNVTDEAGITAVVDEIIKESGGIEILVNNAGITKDAMIFSMSGDMFDAVLKVNLYSAFYLSKALAKHMALKLKKGSIINVSSIVGVRGNAAQVNYSASKAGMIGLTKSLCEEVASRNVRVNAVAPGYIETPMTHQLPEEARKAWLEKIPMRRGGTPEEVAKVILFLASDLASYVTGQVIGIDGGMGK